MDKWIDMYLKFRREIDKMCAPLILECSSVMTIIFGTEIAGMLVYREDVWGEGEQYNYIDAVYVLPEYRRKGLARNAVIKYFEESAAKAQKVRLHIVNNNKAAKEFWNSIFRLHAIDINHVDGFYEICGLREEKEI